MADDKKKLCFVVGPIGDPKSPTRAHADWLLQTIITPVFSANFPDFRVVRADKMKTPGMIDSQMINHLLDAELVIADMSLRNVNAFYEMGIRHMAQKPIIHMFLEGTEIPFDVAPHRAISFSLAHPDDLSAAQAELLEAVKEVMVEGFEVENPVTRARGVQEVREHATPAVQMLLDRVEALEKQQTRRTSAVASSFFRSKPAQIFRITFRHDQLPPDFIEDHLLRLMAREAPNFRPKVTLHEDEIEMVIAQPMTVEDEEALCLALFGLPNVAGVTGPRVSI